MGLQLSRKNFIRLIGLSSVSLAVFTSLGSGAKSPSKKSTGYVRIRPLKGEHYSPSFLKFCERSKFRSTAEAMRKVRNRSKAFGVVLEQKTV